MNQQIGLDPSIANQIYRLLNKLKKEQNITILMVSHDIGRVLKYADTVIEIKNGVVAYDGDVENYHNEYYEESYHHKKEKKEDGGAK